MTYDEFQASEEKPDKKSKSKSSKRKRSPSPAEKKVRSNVKNLPKSYHLHPNFGFKYF
jgi:hypothetical protein